MRRRMLTRMSEPGLNACLPVAELTRWQAGICRLVGLVFEANH